MKIGILTDIHEDAPSLEKAIECLKANDCNEYLCLGDIVGYGVSYFDFLEERNANACIDLVKSTCSTVIAGNHDMHAVKKIPGGLSGFTFPDEWYALNYHERKRLSAGRVWMYEETELSSLLTPASENYLKSLSSEFIYTVDDQKILLTHYFYPDISGSLCRMDYAIPDLQAHFEHMHDMGCEISFCGHGHPRYLTMIYKDRKSIHPNCKAIPEEYPVIVMFPKIVRGNPDRTVISVDTKRMEFEAISY